MGNLPWLDVGRIVEISTLSYEEKAL